MLKRILKLLSGLSFCLLMFPAEVQAQHKAADERLLQAASEGDQAGVLRALLDTASVDAVTGEGITSLMYAAQRGDSDLVRILLYNGADPNIMPANGYSALMSASASGYLEIAETLIRAGSKVDTTDENGVSALMYAAAYNQWLVCDMLLFYQAGFQKKDHDSIDALMAASYMGNAAIAGLLLKNGAHPNTADNHGMTPLWYALKRADLPTVDTLLKSGANPNARLTGNRALTPLFYAKSKRDMDNFKRIKQSGGTINGRPYFSQFLLGFDLADFNGQDYLCGLGAGIFEEKSATSVMVGFDTRLFKKTILEQVDEHYYYQLREGRGTLYLQAQKMFRLPWGRVRFHYGPFVGGRVMYTFGRYEAMNRKVDDQWLLSPQLGFSLISMPADVRVYYAYQDFGTLDLSPHRVGISITFHMNFRRDAGLHSIFWINDQIQ